MSLLETIAARQCRRLLADRMLLPAMHDCFEIGLLWASHSLPDRRVRQWLSCDRQELRELTKQNDLDSSQDVTGRQERLVSFPLIPEVSSRGLRC